MHSHFREFFDSWDIDENAYMASDWKSNVALYYTQCKKTFKPNFYVKYVFKKVFSIKISQKESKERVKRMGVYFHQQIKRLIMNKNDCIYTYIFLIQF